MILKIIAIAIVLLFVAAYLRHTYWFVRCWGVKSKDRLYWREFAIACIDFVPMFRDYGIWRIMTGRAAKAHKRLIADRQDGFNIIAVAYKTHNLIKSWVEQTFPLMRENESLTYEDIRLAVLALNMEKYPEEMESRLDDICLRGSTGGMSKTAMLEFIKNGQNNAPRVIVLTYVIIGLGNVFNALTKVERNRIDEKLIRGQISSVLLDNQLMAKLLGTAITPLPFSNNLGTPDKKE